MTVAAGAEDHDTSLERDVEDYLAKTEGLPTDAHTLRAYWKHAPIFASEDGAFEFQIYGRMLFDLFWRGSDDFPDSETPDDVFMRSARLGGVGHAYHNVIYKLTVDFAKGDVTFKDIYVGLGGGGYTRQVLFGRMFEPFGLETMTSHVATQFMERSVASNAIAPQRGEGILFSTAPTTHIAERTRVPVIDSFERVMGSIGVFSATDDQGKSPNVTARLTGLVLQRKQTHTVVHMGASYSYRGEDTIELADRDGYADTGKMQVSASQRIGFEFAWIWQSLSLSAEYFYTAENQRAGPNANFHGGYVTIGYWITGEAQGWHSDRFIPTLPRRNLLDGASGYGGVWIGYQYSWLDLEDGDIQGGREQVHTFGVSWRWNPNARVMLNYLFNQLRDGPLGTGNIHTLSLRFQWDF